MARRAKKKSRAVKTERLNLMIEPKLRLFMKSYARDKGTSISQLVTNFFMDIREREELPDVEQI